MTTTRMPAAPITDPDRQRACRLAHVFGVATASGVALLTLIMTGSAPNRSRFRC